MDAAAAPAVEPPPAPVEKAPTRFVVRPKFMYTGKPLHACGTCGHNLAAQVLDSSGTFDDGRVKLVVRMRCTVCAMRFETTVPKHAMYRKAGTCFTDFQTKCPHHHGRGAMVRGCWGGSHARVRIRSRPAAGARCSGKKRKSQKSKLHRPRRWTRCSKSATHAQNSRTVSSRWKAHDFRCEADAQRMVGVDERLF